MSNVIHIQNAQGTSAIKWFKGPGWYFLNEDLQPLWGGDTRDEAIVAYLKYVSNIQKSS